MNNTKMMSNRIEWIDVAKGIAMLCIIAGHMGIDRVDSIVFTFHVPVFFLISGYFLRQNADNKIFLVKKAKSLLIPYAFTSVLLIIAKIPVDLVLGRTNMILQDIFDVSIRAIYGSGNDLNKSLWGIGQIGAIWFLLALFWALLIVKLLIDKPYSYLYILIIAVISYVSSQYIWLPWNIQAGGTAAVFVYVGAMYRKHRKDVTIPWWMVLCGVLFLKVEYDFSIDLNISTNYFKYTVVSAVGAIFISCFIFATAQLLEKNSIVKRVFCFYGTNSIMILCFHLVELNNAPWFLLYDLMQGIPVAIIPVVVFLGKLLFVTACTIITLKIPIMRKIFSK